jgi:hypothetical protein
MAPNTELLSFETAQHAAYRILGASIFMMPDVDKYNPYCLLGEYLLWATVDLDMLQSAGKSVGLSLVGSNPISILENKNRLNDAEAQAEILRHLRNEVIPSTGLTLDDSQLNAFLDNAIHTFRNTKDLKMIVMRKEAATGTETSGDGALRQTQGDVLSDSERAKRVEGESKDGGRHEVRPEISVMQRVAEQSI